MLVRCPGVLPRVCRCPWPDPATTGFASTAGPHRRAWSSGLASRQRQRTSPRRSLVRSGRGVGVSRRRDAGRAVAGGATVRPPGTSGGGRIGGGAGVQPVAHRFQGGDLGLLAGAHPCCQVPYLWTGLAERIASTMVMPPGWWRAIRSAKLTSRFRPVLSRSWLISVLLAGPGMLAIGAGCRSPWSMPCMSHIQVIAGWLPVGGSPHWVNQVRMMPICDCWVRAMSMARVATSGSSVRECTIIAISTAWAWRVATSRANPASADASPGVLPIGASSPIASPGANTTGGRAGERPPRAW